MQKIACFESAAIVAEFEQNGARKKYPSGSLCCNTVVGRRVCRRRPSHGVCGSFDDRRPSSRQTTIVVPTKIAWCVPSFKEGRGGYQQEYVKHASAGKEKNILPYNMI